MKKIFLLITVVFLTSCVSNSPKVKIKYQELGTPKSLDEALSYFKRKFGEEFYTELENGQIVDINIGS